MPPEFFARGGDAGLGRAFGKLTEPYLDDSPCSCFTFRNNVSKSSVLRLAVQFHSAETTRPEVTGSPFATGTGDPGIATTNVVQ